METRPHVLSAEDINANPLLGTLGAQEGTVLTLSGPAAAEAAADEGAEKAADAEAGAETASEGEQQ